VNIQEILAKELLASNSSVGHVLAAAQHPGEEEEEEGSNWGGVVSHHYSFYFSNCYLS
jgi:hypothetical protein